MSDADSMGPPSQPLGEVVAATRMPATPAMPAPPGPAAPQRSAAAIARIGTVLARTGPVILYQMNRIGRAGAAGATILLFAVIFVFSAVLPQRQQLLDLDQQIRQAHHLSNTADTPPVRLNRFMNTLPKRSELPNVLGKVFALAGAAGVTLDHGRYELAPTRAGHLAQYRMTFPIKGRYPDIRKFIDSVLTTVPSAALEGLRIERKAVGEDTVAADLRFSVFVRNDI